MIWIMHAFPSHYGAINEKNVFTVRLPDESPLLERSSSLPRFGGSLGGGGSSTLGPKRRLLPSGMSLVPVMLFADFHIVTEDDLYGGGWQNEIRDEVVVVVDDSVESPPTPKICCHVWLCFGHPLRGLSDTPRTLGAGPSKLGDVQLSSLGQAQTHLHMLSSSSTLGLYFSCKY